MSSVKSTLVGPPPRSLPPAHVIKPQKGADRPVRGPTHHPHLIKVWNGLCEHTVVPFDRWSARRALKGLHKKGFVSQMVPTRAGNLHMMRAPGTGKLPPVVFLPGLGSAASDYAMMLKRLQTESRSVLAVDPPGHGKSVDFVTITQETFVGAVSDVLNTTLSEPATLIGHSLGGYVGAHYAAAHPNKVNALVLMGAPGAPVADASRNKYQRLFELRSVYDARSLSKRAFPHLKFAWPYLTASFHMRMQRPALQTLIHSDVATLLLPAERLNNLKMPVFLVWGDSEAVVPSEQLDYFENNLPAGTQVLVVKHMGHAELGVPRTRVIEPIVQFASEACDTGARCQIQSQLQDLRVI